MKHCLTCKCEELPDAKCAPGAAKVQCEYCEKEASFIVKGSARCHEHRKAA